MDSPIKVLVAGGKEIITSLENALPANTCQLVYMESAAQTLNEAGRAGVVVIDERLSGAVDLCRRLRTDPVTAQLPLILRSRKAIQVPKTVADASVLANDVTGLVHVLMGILPELTQPVLNVNEAWDSADEGDEVFDDSEATVIWRRTDEEADAGTWPPPPPTLAEGQDRVEFALNFSGYMNSLIEALQDPGKLSPDEVYRLHGTTHETLNAAERCLGQVQSWINETMMAKDLAQMKVLSTAKNTLYEKVQVMRGLAGNVDPAKEADGPPPIPQGEIAEDDRSKSSSQLEALGLPPPMARSKKSQITLAAEAREARSRKDARANRRQRRRPTGSTSARKSGGRVGGPLWLWAVLAVVAVGGSAAIIITTLSRDKVKKTAKRKNTAPVLERITIDQQSSGLFARPSATDADQDRISFAFTWSVNGNKIKDANNSRLPPTSYRAGDQVDVVVKPFDPYDTGKPMRSPTIRVQMVRRTAPRTPRTPRTPPPQPRAPAPVPSPGARQAPLGPNAKKAPPHMPIR